MHINMDFIAAGLVHTVTGLASAVVLVAYTWWAPVVLGGAWLATHWFLRESAVWHDRNTDRGARRAAPRRLRVPARGGPARGEGGAPVRPVRLGDGALRRPADAAPRAAVPSDPPAREAAALEPARGRARATSSCSGSLGTAAFEGRVDLGRAIAFAQARGGRERDRLRRPQLGARRRVGSGRRHAPTGAADGARGALASTDTRPAAGLPAREIRFRDVTFAYPGASRPVLEGFDLTIPAGTVAGDRRPERRRQDHAGQAAVPALRPAARRDRDRRRRPARRSTWRLAHADHGRVPGLHPLRAAAARQRGAGGRPRRRGARRAGGGRRRRRSPKLDTPLARGYDGRDRALGRAMAARRAGPRAVRGRAGRGSGAARRADRAARRARRGRDLRPHPGRHPRGHDHPRSRTASRPSATPTASACSRTAA